MRSVVRGAAWRHAWELVASARPQSRRLVVTSGRASVFRACEEQGSWAGQPWSVGQQDRMWLGWERKVDTLALSSTASGCFLSHSGRHQFRSDGLISFGT